MAVFQNGSQNQNPQEHKPNKCEEIHTQVEEDYAPKEVDRKAHQVSEKRLGTLCCRRFGGAKNHGGANAHQHVKHCPYNREKD